jgi:hypothetical protein
MAGPSTPATSILTPRGDNTLNVQIEDALRQIEEQDTMIKTLNKQLTHCEGDLQAHMELVGTLETSLNDSERNRKLYFNIFVYLMLTPFQYGKHDFKLPSLLVNVMHYSIN